ncbi:MAG TPA: DUF951 domain-containing protein [Clostridia bacterium]|nr:DUF951 domain-containing protein [Clostridia bacterium]
MSKAIPRLELGDVLKLKKPHPCGSYLWEITRTGADIRIKCLGCGHQVLMPRVKLEKKIREITPYSESALPGSDEAVKETFKGGAGGGVPRKP